MVFYCFCQTLFFAHCLTLMPRLISLQHYMSIILQNSLPHNLASEETKERDLQFLRCPTLTMSALYRGFEGEPGGH